MAEITVNGKKINRESSTLFKDFMNALNRELSNTAQVVSTLKIDNHYIDEIKESNYSMFSLSQISKIDITTADQIELAFEALGTARQYIRKIIPHSKRVAQYYDRGHAKEGDRDFLGLVDALDNLTSLLMASQSVLRGKFKGIHTNDSSLRIAQVRLVSAIEELLPAKKSNDVPMLVDVLGKELPEALLEMCDFGIPVLQRLRTS